MGRPGAFNLRLCSLFSQYVIGRLPVRPSFASPETWYMASLPRDAHLAMLLTPTEAFPSGIRGQTALVQYGTENDYSHETTGKRAGSLTSCYATSHYESSARRQKYICRRAT